MSSALELEQPPQEALGVRRSFLPVDQLEQAGLPRGEALRGHGAKAAACVWSHSELGRIGKISISK